MRKLVYPLLCLIIVVSTVLSVASLPVAQVRAKSQESDAGSWDASVGFASSANMTPMRQYNKERAEAAKVLKIARAQLAANRVIAQALVPTPGGVPDYFGVWGNYATSQLPVIDTNGNVVPGSGIRKFVDSLPGLGPTAANGLGQYIPVANADTITYPGTDYYEIGVVQYTEKMHTDLPPTSLRGYVQLNNGTAAGVNTVAPAPVHYLGPIIAASRGRPVRIKFTNLLPATGTPGTLFVPVDTTIMGAGTGPNLGAEVYSTNRAVIHLHGGDTPWISDGTPHQWVTPNLESAVSGRTYLKGASAADVPDMPVSPGGSVTMYFTNGISARLMFYHDHALGITRLNVYDGMAAGYLLTDTAEQTLVNGGTIPGTGTVVPAGTIPATQIPLVIQDKTFVPNTTNPYTNLNGSFASQLAAQDPTWDTTKWGGTGSLWYPHVYMPNQNPFAPEGVTAMGRWDYGPWFGAIGTINGPVANEYYVPGGLEPPQRPGTPDLSVTGEAFFDTPVVNGTAYPTVTVQPQAYRFRVLSAGNDRFWNLSWFQAAPLTIGVTASGSGYTSVPAVGISGGSVSGAGATASLAIVGFNVVGGTGYTSAPSVSITGGGGIGASGAAILTGTSVSSVLVMTQGIGFTSVPTVTLSGGGGTGASATALLGVVGISVTTPGTASSGPILNPTITISGGGGTGAAAIGSVLSDVAMVPALVNPAYPFPADWVLATDGQNQVSDILDGRAGGVPNPAYMGPSWTLIGNEGGFLPQPAVIPPSPVGYQHNSKNSTWNSVTKKGLYLAPAERADVIVDFSAYAGKTLILYSDAPAPVPLFDVRNDYYTGDPDQTELGGAPSTLAGYGPNTRTIMQVRVAAATPVPFNSTPLNTGLPAAYGATQPPPIVPQSAYNAAFGTSYPDDYVRLVDTDFSPASSPQGVASVVFTVKGNNYYTSVPTVLLSGGGGSGATASVNMAPQGSVTGILVANAGSGYTSNPTVTISGGGGLGATAHAVAQVGSVVRIDVISGGSGYVSPPNVTISAPNQVGGTLAQADAQIGTAFTVTSPGLNYTLPPTVTLSAPGGGGTLATATSYLGIGQVTMLTPGSYTDLSQPPIVTLTGGGGSGAVLVAVMAANPIPNSTGTGNTVASIAVVNPGGGYTSNPTITLSGGGAGSVQATATCSRAVGGLNVTNAGSGYAAAPTVTFTNAVGDTTGNGAAAVAINNALTTGVLGDITVTSPGSGYTTAPHVTFIGGGATNVAAAYATLTNTPNYTINVKLINGAFERYYGRLTVNQGTNLTPYYYDDPPAEIWQDSLTVGLPVSGDGTQIWSIGALINVDSHPLHWHLFDLQVINRIGIDGVIRPPDPYETGWKETIRINPFEELVVAARPVGPKLPFGLMDSVRPLAPGEPIGATGVFTNITPAGALTSVTNQLANFGWEYVWHCHILSHEENDMMRPMVFMTPSTAPAAPTGVAVTTAGGNQVSWTDPTPPTLANSGNLSNEVGFRIQRADGLTGGTFSVIATVPANATSFIDGTVTGGASYHYAVTAFNNTGSSTSNNVSVAGSLVPGLPAVPAAASPTAGATVSNTLPTPFTWGAVAGATSYTLQVLSGATVTVNLPGLIASNINLPSQLLAAGAYTWQVSATNERGTSTFSAARALTVTAPTAPSAPTLVSPASGSSANASANIVLTWGAVSGATSYGLQVTASGAALPTIDLTSIAAATFTIPASTLARGTTYSWQVNAVNGVGPSAWSTPFTFRTLGGTVADFDADGKRDLAVYNPANGDWFIWQSSNSTQRIQNWGWSGATAVPSDYDGDGKTDLTVYNSANGDWFIWQSFTSTLRQQNWGWSGATAVPSDYDGDGKTDLAVYNPANGDWFIWQSFTSTLRQQNWGWSGATAVPGDYDGDGKTDLAVYNSANGDWFIWQSLTSTLRQQNWGWSGATAVPGDYDGDGKTDLAVYNSTNGDWFIWQSSNSTQRIQNWGWSGATAVPGDYDGDGKTDLAVYNSANGDWFIWQSLTSTQRIQNWGFSGAIPVP